VVVAKLNAGQLARTTGDIAQNVNFSVKGELASAFLRRAGITPLTAESRGPERDGADIGETAHRATVFLRCEK
jgi:AraC-like DNA-binding protein